MKKIEFDKKEVNALARELLAELKAKNYKKKPEIETYEADEYVLEGFLGEDFTYEKRLGKDGLNFFGGRKKGRKIDLGQEEFLPRLSRYDFLEQRLGRRNKMNFSEGESVAAEEKEGFNLGDKDYIARNGLPEELSNIYSRDARRYDSPFERY